MGLTIALDAMGGDGAPDVIVGGAELARIRYPDIEFLFYGDQGALDALLGNHDKLRAVSSIRHTETVISGKDKPSVALRKGRGSSMGLAIDAVKRGEAAGLVSAGNTGALMVMAKLALRTLPGITRPAIATVLPTSTSECVMLDLGANIQCDDRNLVEFAIMGEVFARTILGIENPTIGLLNVGAEETKGNDALKVAAQMLRELDLPGEFVGFVEGDDIPAGAVDVVVTDGFTGNVALKTAEGTAKLINAFVRETFRNSFWAKIGYIFAKRSFDKLRNRSDPRRYNGAMFLGLDGVCVKSHGGTDAVGFATAIGVAIDMVKYGGNASLKTTVERLDLGSLRPQAAAAS